MHSITYATSNALAKYNECWLEHRASQSVVAHQKCCGASITSQPSPTANRTNQVEQVKMMPHRVGCRGLSEQLADADHLST
jgi:hypothetical protein